MSTPSSPSPALLPPPEGTLQRWAFDYVLSTELAHKVSPPPPPDAIEPDAPVRRLEGPGRPPELTVATRAEKRPSDGALRDPRRRIQLFHTFFHHELQAAELFAWAILAFPGAPHPFVRGLVNIVRDELRHMAMYAAHIERLGGAIGQHPVRDWFWQRVPRCTAPEQLCAVMGMGLEGGNLDHAARFFEVLRAAGDDEAAQVEQVVGEEEVPHVRFGIFWFEKLTGRPLEADDDGGFARWASALPAPLSPLLMRGQPIDRAARLRAGFPRAFVDRLEAWQPA